MKHLRILVAVASAMVALLALAGPGIASAETVLCTEKASQCPVGKVDGAGTEVTFSLVAGAKSRLKTAFKTIECGKSSFTAKVASMGKTIGATVEGFTFEECNCEVKVLKKGTLLLEHIASSHNATVSSGGAEVTTQCNSIFGAVHCIYSTSSTALGTLEGGNPASLDIVERDVPRLTTNANCDEKANWSAEYEVTKPKPLYVEPEVVDETVLCTEKVSPCPAGKADGVGTEVKLSSTSTSRLTTSFKNIECAKSSITTKVTGIGVKIGGSIEGLTFGECNCEVKVIFNGWLELAHIVGTHNATATSSSAEVTTTCSTIFGTVHCFYATEATDLGTLEGGNPAKIKIFEVNTPYLATNGLCGEKANWDGEYEVTSPKPLYVEPE